MNPALLDRIAPVTSRLRSVRFWRIITIVGTLAIIYVLIVRRWPDSLSTRHLAISVGVGFVVSALAAWTFCRASFRDPRAVAARIERQFPSLHQRLMTALDQSDDQLGYLQQRVIKEARDHSHRNQWINTVPTSEIFWSRLCGWCSIMLLGFLLGQQLLFGDAARHEPQIAATANFDVIVEPGSTQLERGTSMVVTARFPPKLVPETASLVMIDSQSDPAENSSPRVRRVDMTRNLSDPVVGRYLSSVGNSFRYKIVTPAWESETFQVDVFDFPALVRSDADLEFPDYTGLSPKHIEDTIRVSAIEGTQVTWRCYLNKSVETAELVDRDGNATELTADPGTDESFSTTIDLQQTRRMTLKLTDREGRTNKFPPELIARVLANQPPELELTSFGDVEVSPLEELPLAAKVADDVGVTQVGLAYSLDGLPATEVVLSSELPRGSTTQLEHLVELENLHAEPDQLFAYFFWAEDVGPDGEIRRTQSDMYFAEVRPFDQIFRQGQPPPGGQNPAGQNGQQATELAELQKEIINGTWRVRRDRIESDQTPDFKQNIDLLIESQSTALRMLEELAARIRDPNSRGFADDARQAMQAAITELQTARDQDSDEPIDNALAAEQAAYAGLLKLRTREFTIAKSQNQSASSGASGRQMQQQLNDLELEQDENRYESERQAKTESKEEQRQQEIRQILNRLRDLARRQKDLNKEIANLQNALQLAESVDDREQIQRRLKRLREQQQDLLRETDELAERMQQAENRQQLQQSREQLEQTRNNVQQASEALEQQDPSSALSAGRRAEQQFEEMRDDFRRKAAGQFDDAVKQMRESAQKLDQQQEQLSNQLRELDDPRENSGLRGGDQDSEVQKQLEQQLQQLQDLQQQMQQTVQDAETAEPLLAQELYDTFRRSQQQQIDRQLRSTANLLRQGFKTQARQVEKGAGQQIDQLREDLEAAAESVLGDPSKALQRALGELEELDRDLSEELQANRPPPNERTDRNAASENGEAESESSQANNQGEKRSQLADRMAGSDVAPIGGDDFRQWSDRLRDVEEMVDDPELRNQAAQIRDRARGLRRQSQRNNQPPQWNLVETLVAVPLRELKQQVSEALLRRSAERNQPVRIDRDPVPAEYSDAVRRYYESLGGGR